MKECVRVSFFFFQTVSEDTCVPWTLCEGNTKLLQCRRTLGMSVGLHSATRSWETSLPRGSDCPWIFTCGSRGHAHTARTCRSRAVSHDTGVLCGAAPLHSSLTGPDGQWFGAHWRWWAEDRDVSEGLASVNGDRESKYRTTLFVPPPFCPPIRLRSLWHGTL